MNNVRLKVWVRAQADVVSYKLWYHINAVNNIGFNRKVSHVLDWVATNIRDGVRGEPSWEWHEDYSHLTGTMRDRRRWN
jgi:hypothetical protein